MNGQIKLCRRNPGQAWLFPEANHEEDTYLPDFFLVRYRNESGISSVPMRAANLLHHPLSPFPILLSSQSNPKLFACPFTKYKPKCRRFGFRFRWKKFQVSAAKEQLPELHETGKVCFSLILIRTEFYCGNLRIGCCRC